MNSNLAFNAQNSGSFQVAVSTLTLGTLYEAILAFSGHDNEAAFWPAVCDNARWLIPSRRMSILLAEGDERFRIVSRFERGKVQKSKKPLYYQPKTKSLLRVFTGVNANWYDNPFVQLKKEDGFFTDWLIQDEKEMLFIVPIRVKNETSGVILFVTGGTTATDQAMLNTLGTIYALHTGMTYQMICINKERRQMQNRMMIQEKMAALGNLVAGVAHEVNNPIGAINAAADVSGRCVDAIDGLIEKHDGDGGIETVPRFQKALKLMRQNTGVIKTAGDRIAKIVKSLKAFARLDEAEFQHADIHEGIQNTLTLLGSKITGKIEITQHFGNVSSIDCCPAQLNQVFMHLLLNAIDALDGQPGKVDINTFPEEDQIVVQVADSGKGILADHIDKIFEPGFTTKGVGVGTGLGLAICYRIIREHGGSISVDSEPGKGSVFTVKLPG